MFSWLSILKLVLTLANSIATFVREKQLMDEGESRSIARNLSELAKNLEVGKQVVREIEAMPDDELDDALREDK